jgi:hypothetical protein
MSKTDMNVLELEFFPLHWQSSSHSKHSQLYLDFYFKKDVLLLNIYLVP